MNGKVGILIIMAGVVLTVNSLNVKSLFQDEWEAFKNYHTKVYTNAIEERFRIKIYLENRERIAKHNKDPQSGFKMTMNKYGDLLPHEFRSIMNGYRMDLRNKTDVHEEAAVFLAPANFVAPKSVDWRDHGYVTPVKDQGQCGSCWSFSATGSLEGQHKRKLGTLVSLSEQNLVDCSKPDGNEGCNGGLPDLAFKYIKENKGVDTEISHPYEAKDDTCRFKKSAVGADDKGYVDIPQGDEEALKNAVASVGPISVAIDASHESFQFYYSGVYTEKKCSSTDLDHAVLIVGYGEQDGQEYWLVKNSWGPDWGDQGYIKMARNQNNTCGIASQASYPLV